MRQLRHIARMAYGSALAADVRVDGSVPVMSSGGVTGHHNLANTLAPVVVIGRKGSFGSVHWSDDAAFVIDTAYFIDRRLTTTNLRWLYYALQSLDLKGVSQDVGVPGLSREAAYGLQLSRVPNLRDQRRIADFLDDQVALLDRAIELRQRQMALAQEHLSVLIESDIDRFRASSRKLLHVLSLLRDGSHTPPPRVDDGIPILTAKNVKGNRFQFTDGDTRVSEPDADELDRSLKAVPGDLLFSIKGSVGNVAVVPDGVERFVFERNLALFRPRRSLCSATWLYYVLRSRFVQDQVTLGMTFSAQPGIYLAALAQLRVPVPPIDMQRFLATRYQAAQEGLDRLLLLLGESERLLRERKQGLITAAVTGKFDVTTAGCVV